MITGNGRAQVSIVLHFLLCNCAPLIVDNEFNSGSSMRNKCDLNTCYRNIHFVNACNIHNKYQRKHKKKKRKLSKQTKLIEPTKLRSLQHQAKDVLGFGYDCENHLVFYSVNGRWVRKQGFNPGGDLFVLKPQFQFHYAQATLQLNFGREEFRYKPAGFEGVGKWLDRLDVFKELQGKAEKEEQEEDEEEANEEDLDEYEILEAQFEDEAEQKRYLSSNKAGKSGGGGEVRMDCISGQNSTKITQFHAEEAKVKLEVFGESSYPSFVAMNVAGLSVGKWYFEVAFKSVSASNFRAVIGWVSPDFTPDALSAKGVGDQPNTWGMQFKSQKPKADSSLYKINAAEKTKEELIAEEKEKIRKEKEAEELKELANGQFSDDDDEVPEHVESKEQEEFTPIENNRSQEMSKDTLLLFGDEIKTSSVVGCAIDFDNSIISYSLNGEWNPKWRIGFAKEDAQMGGLRPAISLSSTFSNVNMLFGNIDNPEKQFKYPPPEYHFALNLCFDSRVLNHFQKAFRKDEIKLSGNAEELKRRASLVELKQEQDKTAAQDVTENDTDTHVVDEPIDFTDYTSKNAETAAGKDLILWDRPRKYRKKWKGFVVDIHDISAKKENKVSNTVPHLSVFGKLYTDIPQFNRQVEVYLSSALDTTLEMDLLSSDVHPYLRELARYANFHYSVTETGPGSNDPRVCDIGAKEIDNYVSSSCGVAYVAVLGNKYGSASLPALIPTEEFKLLESTVSREVATLLHKWYELDANILPPQYSFRIPTGKTIDSWAGGAKKGLFATKEKEGDCAAIHAGLGTFISHLESQNPERAMLYKGVLENEMHRGIFSIEKHSQLLQSFCFVRKFSGAPSATAKASPLSTKYFDFGSETLAANLREKARTKFLRSQLDHRYKEYNIEWDPKVGLNPGKHKTYLRKFSNYYCDLIAESLTVAAKRVAKLSTDPLMEEVAFHNNFAVQQTHDFVGRSEELKLISNYIRTSSRQPFIVHGASGVGKTALMASAASNCSRKQEHFMIVRFCGKSTGSSTASELMRSICVHLGCIYGQSNANVPFGYNAIKALFRERLALPSAYCPLVLFIDALDQLSDEDQGRQLKWLPKKLPKNVRLIVSCIGDSAMDVKTANAAPFRALQLQSLASVWMHLQPVNTSDSEAMIDEWLKRRQRQLTTQQRGVLVSAINKHESARIPLYLKVAFDLCCTWRSGDVVQEIPGTVSEVIKHVFTSLQKKHGNIVPAALSYITCAKFGLSRNELEDILSLDDEVMSSYFGKDVPAVYRIPSFAWVALQADLKDYIVETRAQGTSVYSWVHQLFHAVVNEIWLSDAVARKQRYHLVAEYFTGTYAKGKAIGGKGPVVDRRVDPQVLYEQLGSSYRFNERRLGELPHCLMHSANWGRLVATLSSFEFITAKCVVSSVSQLISDFTESIDSVQALKDVDQKVLPTLIEYKNFLVQNTAFIGLDPTVVFNLAINMPDKTSPCKGAIAWYEQLDKNRRRAWIKQIYKSQTVYPGIRQLSLDGYMTAIVMSPDGTQFATLYGEDHIVLKIYEVDTFEESAEFKYNRPGKLISYDQIPDDGVKEFQMYEEIDWHDNYICLILDCVCKVNVTNGSVLTCASVDSKLTKCRFSKDGSKIVGLGDGECVIFDAFTGEVINKYESVQYATLSPSGKSLAVVERPQPIVGEQCKANWLKFGKTSGPYPAYIKEDNGDGTFYVQFLDGDLDRRCPAKYIHISRDQNHLMLLDATKKRVAETKKADEDSDDDDDNIPDAPSIGWNPMATGGFRVVQIMTGPNMVDDGRFGHISSQEVNVADFTKKDTGEEEDSKHYLEMCNSIEFSNDGRHLCALMPPSQAVIFEVDETEKTPKLIEKKQYTIPCKPTLCRFTQNDKYLFVLTTSTFHIVEALTGA